MPQDAISFHCGSCFEHLGVQLNMDQGHTIDNGVVRLGISCCVVSKPIEVSVILLSVKSTRPWLQAGTCLTGVCALSSS